MAKLPQAVFPLTWKSSNAQMMMKMRHPNQTQHQLYQKKERRKRDKIPKTNQQMPKRLLLARINPNQRKRTHSYGLPRSLRENECLTGEGVSHSIRMDKQRLPKIERESGDGVGVCSSSSSSSPVMVADVGLQY